jgi:hypothetical protein
MKYFIYKGRFTVVYVSNNCYISDFHWAAKVQQMTGAARRKRGLYKNFLNTANVSTAYFTCFSKMSVYTPFCRSFDSKSPPQIRVKSTARLRTVLLQPGFYNSSCSENYFT